MNAAPDASLNLTLAEFSRDHRLPPAKLSDRVAAFILTAAIGGLLVLFATHRSLWMTPGRPAPSEIVAELERDRPHKTVIPPPPPEFLAHLIRPRAEKPAAPVFTVASETLPAPALLPASAAKTSPLAGGTPAGNGTGPQSVSGNGTNGNGNGLSGCWDAIWARSVRDRVRPFYYYPRRARQQRASGVAVVRLTIKRDGMLEALDIYKSSGNSSLDEAAYDMVKKAQPLPRLPDHMHLDKVTSLFPIGFGAVDSFNATNGTCNG